MYDLVAGKQLVKKSYLLSKSKALEEFPMLKEERLCGALVYYDGMCFLMVQVSKKTFSLNSWVNYLQQRYLKKCPEYI